MPKVSAATLDTAPTETRFTLRGKPYHFIEIDIAAYDRITEECKEVGADGTEKVNGTLQSQKLLQATCVEPAMSLSQIAHLPFGLGNSLMAVINKLYYEIEQPKVVEENETDDDQGEGSPPAP